MNVNIILFDDFETMDAFGPAQIFGMVPERFYMNYLSVNGGIVNSSQGVKVWTEILDPEEIQGIVVIPGGRGANKLLHLEPDTLKLIKKAIQVADYCLMIANGSAIVAQTGLLFHRQVADYPYDTNWKRMFSAEINRLPDIRWTADGKFYSSSCTVAGWDMTLSLSSDLVDLTVALQAAQKLGYAWDYENEDGIFQ